MSEANNMSKEAMKLALEALNKFVSTEWTEPFSEYRYDSDFPSENQFRDEVFTAIKALEEVLAKQEQGEPVAWMRNDEFKAMTDVEKQAWIAADDYWSEVVKDYTIPLYTTPQQRKPLMLEKFREMEELLDDNPHQHKKMFTDDELKTIMETTMPVIDWKARYGVELNNGERNKWMLEWFIAFAKAIEAAHGIKE